jgi:alcohol dehydrogenase YqhD (iron-dependent ADH family)
MINFNLYNPVNLCFGKDAHEQLPTLIPQGAKILMTYGGGSIKQNGVYDNVRGALQEFEVLNLAVSKRTQNTTPYSRHLPLSNQKRLLFCSL